MERSREKESRKYQRAEYNSRLLSLELIDSIKQLIDGSTDKVNSYDELLFKLKRWWCHQYNRPYKDPLLDSYTFEELYFEYYDVTGKKVEDDPMSASKTEIPEEEWDWAEQSEKEEAELELQKQGATKSDIIEDSSQSTDKEWADKVLKNPTADEVDDGGDIVTNFGV
jgi:hypothetical protein